MTNTFHTSNEELKHRVLARKLELEAKLEHIKAENAAGSVEIHNSIQKNLDDLGNWISQGWENLSEATVKSLNEWFIRTDPN